MLQGGNTETLGPGPAFPPANGQCHSRGHLGTASKARSTAGLALPSPASLLSNKTQLGFLVPEKAGLAVLGSVAQLVPPAWLWAQGKSQEGPCPGKKAKCPSQGDTGLGAFAMGSGIWGEGFGCAQESTLRHRGCTGAVVADKDPAAVPLPGRSEKQEKPALCDDWKQTQFQLPAPASFPWLCQLRRRPCRCWGLGGVAACPCKLQASRAPRQQRWLPVQDVPNMPFLPLCHLELPINPEQGTAWPRSRSSAEPDGASREEGFSPSSSMDGVPSAPGGMHCHTIDGNTALPAAGGPGMQEN